MTTWKATAYEATYNGVILVVDLAYGAWYSSHGHAKDPRNYRTAKAAMRAAEKYVDAMTRKGWMK